jgi:hypothetical protein
MLLMQRRLLVRTAPWELPILRIWAGLVRAFAQRVAEAVGVMAETGEQGRRGRNSVEQGARCDVIAGVAAGRKQKRRPRQRVTRACGLKFSRPFRRTGPAGPG